MFYYVHVNFLRRQTNKSLLFLCQARNVTIGAAAAALAAMHDLVYLIQFKDAYDLSRVKCFGFRTKITLGSRVSLMVLHRSLSVKLGVSGLTCELPRASQISQSCWIFVRPSGLGSRPRTLNCVSTSLRISHVPIGKEINTVPRNLPQLLGILCRFGLRLLCVLSTAAEKQVSSSSTRSHGKPCSCLSHMPEA